MKEKANKLVLESLLWFFIAVAAYALTYQFDVVTPGYEWGPAAWPRALLIGIIIASVALWRFPDGTNRAAEQPSEKETDGDPPPEMTLRAQMKRIGNFTVPVIYVFAMDQVGFLLATPFFLIGYMYLLGHRRWSRVVPLGLAIYCAVVLLFIVLLDTPLPQGVWFFYSLNGQILSYLQ